MPSKFERDLSRAVRAVLRDLTEGENITEYAPVKDVVSVLNWWIPDVLREFYPEWEGGELDDVIPKWVRKLGPAELELFGYCWFIDDQSVALLHVKLQVAAAVDKVCWMECELGETGGHGVMRASFRKNITKHLYTFDNPEDVNWKYRATFGTRVH